MALVWIIRQRPGENSSIPLKGFIRVNWIAIKMPPSMEANMNVRAATKYQKTSRSSTSSSWRGSSRSKVFPSLSPCQIDDWGSDDSSRTKADTLVASHAAFRSLALR